MSKLKAKKYLPNLITLSGLLIIIPGVYFFLEENYQVAAIALTLAVSLDMLDGRVARKYNLVTLFGGILDSVTDRIQEGVLFLIFVVHFYNYQQLDMILLTVIALILSYNVSYVKARAEVVIEKMTVGFASRAVRMILLLLAILFEVFEIGILTIVIISFVTVIQRMIFSYQNTK